MVRFFRVRFQILACLAMISSIVVISTMYYVGMKDDESLQPIENQRNPFNREIFSKPKVGANQIILVESSCSEPLPESVQKRVRLNSEQACALESAAKSNPSTSVYLFHLCPLDDDSFALSSPMVKQVFAGYENLYLWHESLEGLLSHSIIDEYAKPSSMSSSEFRVIHFSDLLRYFMLWKYGGTYLDLDFIVTKSLDPLATDFIALESENQANGATIRARIEGTGHEFVERCLRQMHTAFTGTSRQETGPALVTKMLRKFCNVKRLEPTASGCRGLTIYSPDVFYALPYWNWRNFYNATHGVEETMAKVAQSYAVHLWGSMMYLNGVDKEYNEIDRLGKNHPKALLSKEYCPIAYEHKAD